MLMLEQELLVLGLLLLLALAAEAVGRHSRLPRISLLVVLGFVLGPAALGIIDPRANASFGFVAVFALSMVGFLVGGKLSVRLFKHSGLLILWISLVQVLVTFIVVGAGLLIFSFPVEIALLMAAVATATDPAATLDAIRQSRATGEFADILTGVVAIDDAWGLIIFSLALIMVQFFGGSAVDNGALLHAAGQLVLSLLLGVGLGLPMAYLSGRIRKGQPTLMEASGMVLVCAGLAGWLGASHLLASVVMGITVTNFARHHTRPFHAVEEIEWPFLALFFIFSGAYLTLDSLLPVAGLLVAYLCLRVAGRLLGGSLAILPRGLGNSDLAWIGAAMLPQAGVAMAMAFEASSLYPELVNTLLPVVIAATVLFELFGPIITERVLRRQAGISEGRERDKA